MRCLQEEPDEPISAMWVTHMQLRTAGAHQPFGAPVRPGCLHMVVVLRSLTRTYQGSNYAGDRYRDQHKPWCKPYLVLLRQMLWRSATVLQVCSRWSDIDADNVSQWSDRTQFVRLPIQTVLFWLEFWVQAIYLKINKLLAPIKFRCSIIFLSVLIRPAWLRFCVLHYLMSMIRVRFNKKYPILLTLGLINYFDT